MIGFKKEAENVVNKFHLPTFSFSIVMRGCPKIGDRIPKQGV